MNCKNYMWLKFVKDRIDGLFCRFINAKGKLNYENEFPPVI